MRKHVFYKHTNIVTKKWGKKNASKIFFQKHTYIAGYKRWKKIVLKKCENTFFYKHMNFVTKNGVKNFEKNIFPETHRFRKQTTMEKNCQEKVRIHVFVNIRISSSKNGGKKTREKIFPKIHE